ncbi:MAG: hypothetical protein LKF36_07920 [Lactobacillus sp.]|jgi:uncharacterized membrane protein|nr:hypothetical protein [Lactobacillus sp.]
MTWTQALILIGMFILLVAFAYSVYYREKKRSYYGNDERWREIETRASKYSFRFLSIPLMLMILVQMFVTLIPRFNVHISLSNALSIAIYVIVIGQVVELGALYVFDKRM